MMKITLVHGQNHMGSSYHAGRLLAEKLGDNEITEFFLPRDLNHFCLGCYGCIEDDKACPFYEEKKRIMDAVEEAELLIFTTPNYCLAPSGAMKSFIDLTFTYWMVHRPRKCMFTKKAVVISTTAGAGAGQAVKIVKKALFYWGVPWIRGYGISVQAKNWKGVADKKKDKIDRDMTRLAADIKRRKTPRAGIRTRFIFSMMRKMQLSGWGSSPVEKEYWDAQGWLAKGRPWR